MTFAKRTASDVYVKRWIGVFIVRYKSGRRKTLKEKASPNGAVLGCLMNVPDPAVDVSVVENDTIERGNPWDLGDLTSTNDGGPSAQESVQKLCRTYGLAVPSNFLSVQKIIKDKLTALASNQVDKASLVERKKTCNKSKEELEAVFQASESTLLKSEHRLNDIEL